MRNSGSKILLGECRTVDLCSRRCTATSKDIETETDKDQALIMSASDRCLPKTLRLSGCRMIRKSSSYASGFTVWRIDGLGPFDGACLKLDDRQEHATIMIL
mgnify:CR=1 FL=1